MGKTITEKILSRAGKNPEAKAGDIVNADISFVMTNDAVAELTIEAFEKLGKKPWNNERIAVILDHYIPASTENAARVHYLMRRFSEKHNLRLLDMEGVCHQLMIENFVSPGDVVIGTDSHTCTYGGMGAFSTGTGSTDGAAAMATGKIWLKIPESIRVELKGALRPHVHAKDIILKLIGETGSAGATYKAIEFAGEGAKNLDMASRFTICNMAIEAGAKSAIFEPDETTAEFMKDRPKGGEYLKSDPDAEYCIRKTADLDSLEPQAASPWSPENTTPVTALEGTAINQAFVGACTNGRIEDLRVTAAVLKGRKVSSRVRFLITPASQTVMAKAVQEGLIDIFIEAGAVICNPGCSACFGGQGMLWEGEVCIGSHNRNFRGRMGHKNSRVFLASPETVAVSAVAGEITDPRKFL